MISTNTIIALWVTTFFTTVVPLILIILLCVKKKISVIPFFVGAAAFFVAQPILRMTIMGILQTQQWYVNFVSTILGLIIVGGLTAGLFEESARLIGGKLLKSRNTYRDSISFGIGHGLCEVMFLGISHFSNAIMVTMLTGDTQGALAKILPAETIDLLLKTFSGTEPYLFYVGIVERVFAVLLHIALTVLVFYGIREKKIWCYIVAILMHTVANSGAVLLMNATNIWFSELFLLLIATACAIFIFKMKPKNHIGYIHT